MYQQYSTVVVPNYISILILITISSRHLVLREGRPYKHFCVSRRQKNRFFRDVWMGEEIMLGSHEDYTIVITITLFKEKSERI